MQNRIHVNFTAFAALADANLNAELREHGVQDLVENDPELAEAIAAIEKESKANAIRAAAEGIVALKQASNEYIAGLVDQLREIRRQERSVLAQISVVNKARDFAAATRNYMPLISIVTGVGIPMQYMPLMAAFEKWEPEKAPEAKPKGKAAK